MRRVKIGPTRGPRCFQFVALLTVALFGQSHVLAQDGEKWATAEPDDRNQGCPMPVGPMPGDSHWLALVAGASNQMEEVVVMKATVWA